MKLIDTEDDTWVWVEDFDYDCEFSPQFDTEKDAREWYNRVAAEILKEACR